MLTASSTYRLQMGRMPVSIPEKLVSSKLVTISLRCTTELCMVHIGRRAAGIRPNHMETV